MSRTMECPGCSYRTSYHGHRQGEFQGNRHVLNRILKGLCEEHDFTFIDNSESIILRDHIGYDGVHLNSSGTQVFMKNILKFLNE